MLTNNSRNEGCGKRILCLCSTSHVLSRGFWISDDDDFSCWSWIFVSSFQFWKELKEGQKRQAPEMMDLLLQQQQQAEQRPHSSVGHYEGQPRRAHHKEANGSSDSSDKTNLLLLLDKDKVNMTSPTKSQIGVKPNEKSEGIDEFSDDSKLNEDEVEIRSPSRKVSQDRPRLDKSQSTPTYEIVVGDTSSFEEKLREIRLRKQSRVEEEVLNPIAEDPNTSPSLTLPPSKFS